MVKDTWETRERPLLEAIADADADGRAIPYSDDLVALTNLPRAQVEAGLRALYDAAMIDAVDAADQVYDLMEINIREKGRRAVGQWPMTDPVADLIRLLESQIAAERDNTQRTRLERLLAALRDVGTDLAAKILVALIARQAGTP